MKKLSIGLLLFICLISVNAQDIITLKNGETLSVFIIEKNDSQIKYKMANSVSYAVFTTKLRNVKSIQYEYGGIDLLSSLNPRSTKPLGISAGISFIASESEGGMFTGGLDYFFTPNLSAEINMGTDGDSDMYYSFGGKYWFASNYSKSSFSPFTGLLYGGQYGVNFWEVPIGISYISKIGLQSSFHFSYLNYIDAIVFGTTNRLNAELRVGWRF